jgi:tetratricopeptide (TPR) repeat protein
MHSRPLAVVFLIAWTTGAAAQQGQPSVPGPPVPCKDRSVDEYLAEMHKRKRNKNPLPTDTCILAWCPHTEKGKDDPVEHPPQAPPVPSTEVPKAPPGESSSQPGNAAAGADLRGTSLYNPIEGAKNVEAGDYYFEKQNYRAALSRFQEALQDKPDDAAIQLRLGRTCEKVNLGEEAYEHYDAALILSPDGPGAKQAREGLERLRPQLAKAGADTAAIHERNVAAIAASCH